MKIKGRARTSWGILAPSSEGRRCLSPHLQEIEMPDTCAKCGAALTPDKPFCGMCGAPVVAAPPHLRQCRTLRQQVQAIRQCSPLRRPRLRRIRRCCHRQHPKAPGSLQCQRQQCPGYCPVQSPAPPSGAGFTPMSTQVSAAQAFQPIQPSQASSGGPAYTPVQTAAPAAAAPAFAAVPQPAGGAYPPQAIGAQSESGSTAIKIVLIVLAIFVGLGILVASFIGFAVWRVSRSIHLNGSNGQVSVQTPGGLITTNRSATYSASELGADLYPGAQSTPGGMRMDLPTGSMVSASFVTSDSKDAVVNFYKGKFGSDASVFDAADSAVISVNKGPEDSVVVTVTSKPSENDGKTKIVILHTKGKSS